MKLSERIDRYLSRHDRWVGKRELENIARKNGYTFHALRDGFRALEKMLHVGQRYVTEDKIHREGALPRGMYYRHYHMTPEEKAKQKADLDWFDNL